MGSATRWSAAQRELINQTACPTTHVSVLSQYHISGRVPFLPKFVFIEWALWPGSSVGRAVD